MGACPRCDERQAHITALEKQLSDALDRVMSRDYSHLAFVRTNTERVPASTTGDGETAEPLGDGLD